MLVLTRKSREKLMIGDDIAITILDVSGTQVRIGIEAPREVSVHRLEIYKKIAAQRCAEQAYLDTISAMIAPERQQDPATAGS